MNSLCLRCRNSWLNLIALLAGTALGTIYTENAMHKCNSGDSTFPSKLNGLQIKCLNICTAGM